MSTHSALTVNKMNTAENSEFQSCQDWCLTILVYLSCSLKIALHFRYGFVLQVSGLFHGFARAMGMAKKKYGEVCKALPSKTMAWLKDKSSGWVLNGKALKNAEVGEAKTPNTQSGASSTQTQLAAASNANNKLLATLCPTCTRSYQFTNPGQCICKLDETKAETIPQWEQRVLTGKNATQCSRTQWKPEEHVQSWDLKLGSASTPACITSCFNRTTGQCNLRKDGSGPCADGVYATSPVSRCFFHVVISFCFGARMLSY